MESIEPLQNWARNLTYGAKAVQSPTTIEELQETVRGGAKIKALGSRHSFSDIADTDGTLVLLGNLNQIYPVDKTRNTVTVEAGVTYSQLCPQLESQGYALPNLASLPHISVIGACATGTHGSGVGNGCLSTSVSELEIVKADGSISKLTRDRDGDEFLGAVVGLGALGVVARVTLNVLPSYQMSQRVFDNLSWGAFESHWDAILSSSYSVSLFTDWRSSGFKQVWVKSLRGTDFVGDEFFGAKAATTPRHPIPTATDIEAATFTTEQLGVPGPWFERLPHFRTDFTPSSGEELQTEYLVPRENTFEALRALNQIRDQIASLLQISEIRTVAKDDLWMSPSYGRDSLAIHFTWKKDWDGVRRILPLIEDRLRPFAPRPHWGKLFLMPISHSYSHYDGFCKLRSEWDPEGKFGNAFLARLFK